MRITRLYQLRDRDLHSSVLISLLERTARHPKPAAPPAVTVADPTPSARCCLCHPAQRYLSTGAPSVVAAQLVTSTAGAALAVFAKAPSILWPLPLHEELVRAISRVMHEQHSRACLH
jgi:hypothetical protein